MEALCVALLFGCGCEEDVGGFDIKYIVTAANHADKLARALLVMEEALKKINHGDHDNRCLDGFRPCDSCVSEKALAEAERIFKEERNS